MKNKKHNSNGFALLGLSILVLAVSVVVLTGWGIAANHSSKKEVDAANQKLLAQTSSLPNKTSTTTPAPSASPVAPTPAPASKPATNANTSPANSTPPTPTTPPSPIPGHPNDDDRGKAKSNLYAIHSDLEVYWVQGTYYPSDISPSNFTGLCSGDCSSAFTPTPGISIVYNPTPSGCTTAAQNCKHYTLSAVETSGAVVLQLQSVY